MEVGTGGEPECGWRWEGGGIEVGAEVHVLRVFLLPAALTIYSSDLATAEAKIEELKARNLTETSDVKRFTAEMRE